MHPVIELLRYILYNLILNQIISGRWGPATGTLLLVPPNVNFMPANFAAPPPILENENCVNSQCPEFYAEDTLMLSQVIYLGLLWLGLIVLLNPGVTIGIHQKIFEAVLVVNHQFYVDLGGNSPSLRNSFILSSDFRHNWVTGLRAESWEQMWYLNPLSFTSYVFSFSSPCQGISNKDDLQVVLRVGRVGWVFDKMHRSKGGAPGGQYSTWEGSAGWSPEGEVA
ncbi:hypothetical protein DSO57_1001951 [Entomophthora muscae]|uniref:Uncharacterized protein n=1 Tax=Entomophthora muscae TaxID=34485 RepID=A0ACC2UUI1_9FUNG|nr:hypothetical protein DSO57_1001951 [Entomophthora muscae]